MRKLMTLGLIAATLMPAAASAQSWGEIRRDQRDLRQEQRELDRAYRSGNPYRIQEERRDVRQARQELREDYRDRAWGRDDWRDWRRDHRDIYARGRWDAPFRYQAFRPGVRIAPGYWGGRYYIADPWRYHLPPARPWQRWVRHYDDVLLIDTRRGVVVDVYRGFFF